MLSWLVTLLLIAIPTASGSGNCALLEDLLNINTDNGQIEIRTTETTPPAETTTKFPSLTPPRTISSTITPPKQPTTTSTTANTSNAVNELNSFAKLYSMLRTYHENELKRVQSRYERLEVFSRNKFEEIQRNYDILEATVRTLKSSKLNPIGTCCESDSRPKNDLHTSQDINLLNKFEEMYHRTSILTDANAKLLHKIEQVYDKLSNVTDAMNITTIISHIGHLNCSTNISNKDHVPIHTTSPAPIDVRTNNGVEERTHRRYLGCYQDRQERRLLVEFMKHSKINSVDACVDNCRAGNYVFAGLEG